MKINFTLNRTKNFNNICVAALNRQRDRERERERERATVCLTDSWIEGHRLPDRERWPGDKFLLLVKQVIKVDLSTMEALILYLME